MTLPARQQAILDKIEAALHASDPRLKGMFAIFTRLASRDAMPTTEAIVARLPRPAVLISIVLVGVLSVVLLGLFSVGTACPRLSSDQEVAPAAVRLAGCNNSTDAWSKGGR
jgi:Protein of unknown function (DUF3040)